MISIIVAMTKDRVIGKSNKLIWNIPEDMKHFKETTSDSVVVMGRKTFDSIGRPLPNRENIVISRSMPETEGVIVCRSIEEALEKAKTFGKEIFVIGGSTIYEQCLPHVNRMFISYVKKDYDGDAHFPAFKEDEWKVTSRKDFNDFELVVYER